MIFSSANTEQPRHFLPPTPILTPIAASSTQFEVVSVTQWRKFWRAKIPHRAKTMWWRYKRDILPYGTLCAHRWGLDPKCGMKGCRGRRSDKKPLCLSMQVQVPGLAVHPEEIHRQAQPFVHDVIQTKEDITNNDITKVLPKTTALNST